MGHHRLLVRPEAAREQLGPHARGARAQRIAHGHRGAGAVLADGRWVAYNSDESGRMEVYVRPFAEAGGRVQISVAGGRRPV